MKEKKLMTLDIYQERAVIKAGRESTTIEGADAILILAHVAKAIENKGDKL